MKLLLISLVLCLIGCCEDRQHQQQPIQFRLVRDSKIFQTDQAKQFAFANGQKGILLEDDQLIDWLEKHKDVEIISLTACDYHTGNTSSFVIIYRELKKSNFQ